MIGQRHCPFCKTPALKGCAHLALATEARDFVRRCVESCQGQLKWQALRAARRANPQRSADWSPEREDFTWLETAFCKEFLEPLRWFGGMDYEWRSGPTRSQGGFWVLLWSKDPQRLWWELLDEFERHCSSTLPVRAKPSSTPESPLAAPHVEWSSILNPPSHPRSRRPNL